MRARTYWGQSSQNSATNWLHGNLQKVMYEVFTSEPLTDQQLNLIFSEYTDHTAVDWMAYPEYVTPEIYPWQWIVLCIEHVASVMDMSCIGGKNVSLLVNDYLVWIIFINQLCTHVILVVAILSLTNKPWFYKKII